MENVPQQSLGVARAVMPCALAVLLGNPMLPAQTAPSDAPSPAQLARYDANRNGVLEASELAQMRADEANAVVTATPTTSPTGARESIMQMSPFEVSAAGDRGYFASNTMSGTRLNSKLEDLGSSISVVTRQQLEDFALLDINDIFLYEANTEGTGNFTDFAVDRNGNVIDNVSGNPNNANRIRGITAANQSMDNFPTNGRIPLDPLNLESVEISRGPNSSIFGLGNASGTVNVISAKANLQRETTRIETRVDSLGSLRGSVSFNRPILKNKLAIRASGLWQNDEYRLEPSGTRTRRYNGAVTYQPFKNTKIQGMVDYYDNFARRPNSIPPRDAISYWESVGRPTWDPTTWTVTRNGVKTVVPYTANQVTETGLLGPGLESGGTLLYARPSLFIEPDGSVPLWMVGRQSGVSAGIPTPNAQTGNVRFVQSAPEPKPGPLGASYLSLTDKAYYDWTKVNIAAPNWSRTRGQMYMATLEHFFLNTPRHLLGAQLGWFREEAKVYSRTFISQGSESPMITYIDVNEKLLDGRPNPYFRRPYINAVEPTATRNKDFREQFRAQLAYALNLSRQSSWLRWVGDHQFLAYGEYKNRVIRNVRYRDALIDDHTWLPFGTARGNGPAAARGYYRYYLGDANGNNIDYAPPAWRNAWGTYNLNWYNGQTQQWVTEPGTFGEVYSSAGFNGESRNVIKTTGGAVQNHLFDGRIVTTFGRRKDINLNRNSANTALSWNGIDPDFGTSRTWPDDWFRRDGETTTSGVVVKPLRNWEWMDRLANRSGLPGFAAKVGRSLTFHYNKADSFLPEITAQNLLGELLPDPRGKGKDYGFTLNVLDGRLVLRFNQYETTQVNSRAGESGTIATRASRIDFSGTGGADRFNLARNATEWTIAQNPTWTTDQVVADVARQMGFPPDRLERMNAYPLSDTSDVTSKGKEIEVHFNPNNFITTRMTVGQMRAVDTRLSPAIGEYIANRWDLWRTIVDPRTNTLWWTTLYGANSPETFFVQNVQAPYQLATANDGKPKSQTREWRVNMFGSLRLGMFTENRWLSRFAVTGAVRWEDKSAIGFYGAADDPNSYDPNRPIFDQAHTYFDAGLSYTQKIFRDRVRMRVQLNGRNITEGGRLQPIGSLPDGRIYNFRIIDPRLFILTASFDL